MQTSSLPHRRLGDLVSHTALGVNVSKTEPGTTSIVRVSDLPDEVGYLADETQLEQRAIKAGKARDKATLEHDDLILVARGSSLRIAIANPGMDGMVIANNLMLIRTNPAALLGPVLAAWLGSPRGQHELSKVSRSSTTMMSLRAKDVLEVEVPVPPMAVQQHISELLWTSSLAYRDAISAAELRERLVRARCAELLGGAA